MWGVVSHQVLGQKDAWIESVLDALVDLTFLGANKSIDLTWELLKSRYQSWIDLICKVDIKVLLLTWNINDCLLGSKDLFDDPTILLLVILSEIIIVIVTDDLCFGFLQHNNNNKNQLNPLTEV